MASVERKWVRPNKGKHRWHFPLLNGLATVDAAWVCSLVTLRNNLNQHRLDKFILKTERLIDDLWKAGG